MKKPEVLYHYTTGNIFRKILHQGAIEPDRTEINNEQETPTVTFSSHPEWERTRFRVGKLPDGQLIMMSQQLLNLYDGGLYRIVVPSSIAPLDWYDMKDTCGISKEALKGIYDFALSVGARTSHWYATTERVPEEVWINVEKMNAEGAWVELSEDEIPEPSAEPTTNMGFDVTNPVQIKFDETEPELIPVTDENLIREAGSLVSSD
jgi:hypothetical protein